MYVITDVRCELLCGDVSLTFKISSPLPTFPPPFVDQFVMDTHNSNLWQLTEILYFDPYMRLHSYTLQKICDEGKQAEDLTEDLLLDFSYDYVSDAHIFQEMLLEGNNRG